VRIQLDQPRKVLARWVDSAQMSGWLDPTVDLDSFGTSIVETLGILVHETLDEVWIAQSSDTRHGRIDSILAIPKRCLHSFYEVKEHTALPWGNPDDLH
jgi:hypothetical protein